MNNKLLYMSAMLIFGSIGLFARNISLESGQIALVRGLIGSLFLLIACPIMKQKISWKAIRPNLPILIISGAGIGFNWILMLEAYQYTSIANATLSYYFAPVLVMLLSPFFLKEKLTYNKLLCIFFAIVGMFLIIGISTGEGKNHLLGIGYGLFAAVLYASVVIMNKFVKGLSGIETTLVQLGFASIVLLPYILLTQKLQIFELDQKSMAYLVTLGIVHTGLAYLLYFTAMNRLSGQTIAIFSYIDPISAILLSSVILQETMTVLQIFGGILILGATLLSEMADRKHTIMNKKRSIS